MNPSVRRAALAFVIAAMATGGAVYLHDPAWVAHVTSGMRAWEKDPDGRLFRWTAGHGAFYVPSAATAMVLPLRSFFPGPGGAPVIVRIAVDDRPLTDVVLDRPDEWKKSVLPMPRESTRRRYRRIDLRVSRTVGPYLLGVAVGEPYFPDFLRRSAQ